VIEVHSTNPALPASAEPAAPSPQIKSSKAIADLIEPYMRERHRAGISVNYAKNIRTAMDWFSQWFGPSRQVASVASGRVV